MSVLKPKTKIRDYEIICTLGEGRYSTVYKVLHIPTKVTYAMKYVRKDKHLYNKAYVNNEKNILKYLPEHTNIVKHFSDFEENGYTVFIMEYVNGFTLQREIIESATRANVPISFECKKNYILQIIDGLKALHATNIYHCDVKPENVVLQGETVKIIDFSCAYRSEEEFVNLEKKCINTTPGYGPPEIYDLRKQGASLLLPAIDCWSLGVLIFFVFSAKNPFQEKFVGQNFIASKVAEVNYRLVRKEIADLCKAIFKESAKERLTIDEVSAILKSSVYDTTEFQGA